MSRKIERRILQRATTPIAPSDGPSPRTTMVWPPA